MKPLVKPLEHHLFICTNERSPEDPKGCCALKRSALLHQHAKERCHELGLKSRVRINKAGCLDRCALGPAVVVYGEKDVPGGVWYTVRSIDEMDRVVDEHLVGGCPVADLLMPRCDAPGAMPWTR